MKLIKTLTLASIILTLLLTVFTGCDKRALDLDQYDLVSFSAVDTLYSGFETELEALVLTKKGVPAPGQTVTFKADKGIVEASAVTNEFGIATAKFYHNISSTVVANVQASIHKSKKNISVTIVPFEGDYGITSILALPDSIYQDNNLTTSAIRALVKDKEGVGVTGKLVKFKTDKGQITSFAATDSSGVAIATFGDNGDVGEATVTAAVDGSFRTIKVKILPVVTNYDIKVTASHDVIYNDNNITVSVIKARVVDHEKYPVVEEPVRFRARNSAGEPIGQIASLMLTDTLGVATSIFKDAGDLGTAYIQATYGSVHGTVKVDIVETPEVAEVRLVSLSQAYGLDQELTLRAEALDVNGDYVADGTLITFDASLGDFEENIRTGVTANGSTSVKWNTGTQAGTVRIKAMVGGVDGKPKVQDIQDRVINPGPPAFLNPIPFYEDDEGEMSTIPIEGIPVNFTRKVEIRAVVTDEFSNPVRENLPIHFETSIGGIQPVASTNSEGIATAVYYPGVSAGTCLITAKYAPTGDGDEASGTSIFTIFSDHINTISFAQEQDMYLDVRGVGGIESRGLKVELFDFNGNLVSGHENVKFELVAPVPAGANINNIGNSDIVLSNNGVAVASINSGTGSGTIRVKASLVENPAIQATKSNIVIRSGQPNTVQPLIGDFNTGTALGGGLWRIQASAIVKDVYGNPVIDGTAVHFTIESEDPTEELPGDMSIVGHGFVGNIGDEDPDGSPGVAYTHLTYNGRNTYDKLYVRAESGGIQGSALVTLPINGPTLELIPDRLHVNFFQDDEVRAYADVKISITLADGQGNPISNGVIDVASTHGFFFEPKDVQVKEKTTYITREGKTATILRLRMWECPEPTEDYYLQEDVLIVAFLAGTNTITQTQTAIKRFMLDRPPGA
ncbi:MAG: hypothetical protein WCX83_00535 [Candidatus Cloacimonas sp.]|nr:hypothetical protein [Candidatus Cloacimonadota bacterium]